MSGREVIVRAVFTSDAGVVGQVFDRYAGPFEYLYETEVYPIGSPQAEQAAQTAHDWAIAQGHVVVGDGG